MPQPCIENIRRPLVVTSPRGEPFVTDVGAPVGPCSAAKDEHCTLLAPLLPKGHTATCHKIHGHAFVGEEEV